MGCGDGFAIACCCDSGACEVKITLPWSVCVPDNAKSIVAKGRLILSSRYRTAKRDASLLMRVGNAPQLWAVPCRFAAVVWFPDARKRDAGNLRKLLTDAAQHAFIIADDSWIHDERWTRGGIDRVNPRVEITIEPLA